MTASFRDLLILAPASQLSSDSIFEIMKYSPSIFEDLDLGTSIAKKIVSNANSDRGVISRPAIKAREVMINSGIWDGDAGVLDILS